MAPFVKHLRMAIFGSRCVGKTSLTVQYCDGYFVESYYPTVENSFSHEITYNRQTYSAEIIDAAGHEEDTMMNSKHLVGTHGYMLVYSVASRLSFDMITVIRDNILDHLGAKSVPIMIIGNKCDVRPELRVVSAAEGQNLGSYLKCGWIETSARSGENAATALELMVAEIEKLRKPENLVEGGKCAVM